MHFFTFVDSIFVLQYIIRMCIDVIALANKSNQIALHLLRNVLSHQVPYLKGYFKLIESQFIIILKNSFPPGWHTVESCPR